jgi:hypothetical protein
LPDAVASTQRLKVGTVDTYELHLRNHTVPAFGDFGLAAIRPTMDQQWVMELSPARWYWKTALCRAPTSFRPAAW